MLTAFSWLGRLAWPLLGSLVPGLSPALMLMLAGALAALVIVGGPAGIVWLSMRGAVTEARQARDLHWQTEITNANRLHDQKLDAARHAADTVLGTPDDRAERLRVCQSSPTCRDRGR